MASSLRRQLISLQKQQNQNRQVGPYSRASAANMKNTSATVSRGGSPRAKKGGTVKYAPKNSILNPSGESRSPLNTPEVQPQTARVRYYKQPNNKNGVSAKKGKNVKRSTLNP